MAGTVSNALLKNKEKIMALWLERCQAEVSSAVTAERLVLRNSLPVFLDHIAEALATNRKMDLRSTQDRAEEGIRIGRLHGEDRAGNTSFGLTEVIFEYHIFREVIFQVLEADVPVSPLSRDIILSSIEQAVNDAAVKFSEVHADVQQKFISTLTHDLKTPITAAKMSAQLMLRRPNDGELCLEHSAKIVGNMNRLTQMIHDLLDAGRVRAGEQLALQFENCDLAQIAREVVAEMGVAHGDCFSLKCDSDMQGQWARDGIRRALENLMGNAVKYGTPKGRVTIILRRQEKLAEITVHNLGTPIPEKEIPRMFEVYRRTKSSENGGQLGWGLGLTLVKGVTDAHKGKIRVESTADSGTSFILELPEYSES